jgi:hypothetical protein
MIFRIQNRKNEKINTRSHSVRIGALSGAKDGKNRRGN